MNINMKIIPQKMNIRLHNNRHIFAQICFNLDTLLLVPFRYMISSL